MCKSNFCEDVDSVCNKESIGNIFLLQRVRLLTSYPSNSFWVGAVCGVKLLECC